jgi:hypothetical protein
MLESLFVKAQLDQKPQSLYEKIIERFSFDPGRDSVEKISEKLNNLRQAVVEARQSVSGDEGQGRLHVVLDRAERSLDFFSDIKRLIYIQIPIWNNDEQRDMGLYVFQDKEKKNVKNKKLQSALLSLDFAFLGHFEAYIQKHGQGINIWFKTEDEVRDTVRKSVSELGRQLAERGYRLDSYTFAENRTPFCVTDTEPKKDAMDPKSSELKNLDLKA